MAGRQEQVALMGIESELVYLAGVLMQPSEFYTGAIDVVQNNLAISGGGGNVRAKLTMGPLDVVDAETFSLPRM